MGHDGITFGSLVGHVGVTFSSFWGHVGMSVGTLLGGFRIGLGGFWEQKPAEVEKTQFSEVPGSIFPASGRSKQSFLAYSRTEQNKKTKIIFS